MTEVLLPLILVPAVFVLTVLLSVKTLMHTSAPNEVLVFTSGRAGGYRVLRGGIGFRVPLLEKVSRMDVSPMLIDLNLENAHCSGGIPLSLKGVAEVKVGLDDSLLPRALERFLGRGRSEVTALSQETLEGTFRDILSTMDPEQVKAEASLAERLVQESQPKMTSLGLVVESVQINHVTVATTKGDSY